jgi:ABC-type Zn uptake system ZnuABC Zn-binding protein ZnuA/ABC-type Mn2+/Zn2+ transport system permease subunit
VRRPSRDWCAPLGAFGAAVIFAAGVGVLARSPRARYDNLTALVLTGALALGVLLASDVFHSGTSVETLLFGSLFLVEPRDIWLAAAASAAALGAGLALGPLWLASGFDDESARMLGLRRRGQDAVLLLLVALLVVASLSAVGALLAAAVLVVPAATARLWTNRIVTWQVVAVLLTCAEGIAGLWLSVKLNAPPGATIATLGGAVFAIAAAWHAVRRATAARVAIATAALAMLGLAAAGCGATSSGSGGGAKVVATTTQLGDWVRQVSGPDADVHQILRPNTDPHEYEPRPADVAAVADAKLVFTNGDGLDAWAGKLVDEAGGDPRVVDLSHDLPDQLPGEGSGAEASAHDPHWWHDPVNAIAAVDRIGVELGQVDPAHRAAYAHRARAYEQKLRTLDRQVHACIDRIPAQSRKLVTDHDAFGYFAHRYGLEVVGAVIPSQTTQAQPSAGDLSHLADVVRRAQVHAVFPERSLSPKLAQAIARETGAGAGLELYGDTLGPASGDAGTYLDMEAVNARTIALGLSGGRVRCTVGAL